MAHTAVAWLPTPNGVRKHRAMPMARNRPTTERNVTMAAAPTGPAETTVALPSLFPFR